MITEVSIDPKVGVVIFDIPLRYNMFFRSILTLFDIMFSLIMEIFAPVSIRAVRLSL